MPSQCGDRQKNLFPLRVTSVRPELSIRRHVPQPPLPWLADWSQSRQSGPTPLPVAPWHRGLRFHSSCKAQPPRAPGFRRSGRQYLRPRSLRPVNPARQLPRFPPVRHVGLPVLPLKCPLPSVSICRVIAPAWDSAISGCSKGVIRETTQPHRGKRLRSKDHPGSPPQWGEVFVRLQSLPDCRAASPPHRTRAVPAPRDLECEAVLRHESLLRRVIPRTAEPISPAHWRPAFCSQSHLNVCQ